MVEERCRIMGLDLADEDTLLMVRWILHHDPAKGGPSTLMLALTHAFSQ